ncbi:isochorismatase family protein [uncultured Paracoccus sp.]|uniref:isochorismatase family protein n=1 Tax=uncultured Paracoccus sp. TaxID=189685 RepID=UPI00261C1867|nr:isochorismatase family protein [uncultured Paracoccus sp.]
MTGRPKIARSPGVGCEATAPAGRAGAGSAVASSRAYFPATAPESRIDTLILTGCSTSGCVRATAVDAIQYGFRPMVPRETVCDRWSAAHEQALSDMDAKYADVMSTEEAIAGLYATKAHQA